MRKLILSMALAILSTSAYTQGTPVEKAVTGTTPSKTLTCDADNSQNPIVGKKYTYTVEGQNGTYHFFATNQTTFIQGKNLKTDGAYENNNQIRVGTGNYNDTTSESKQIEITWTKNVTETSYLVVNHKLKDGACTTTNNLKVLEIKKPRNAFFIELRNMDKERATQPLGATVNVCLGQIESAELTASKDQIVYDYGQQSLFYELIAINYDGTFVPQIKVEGLQNGQTAKLKWGYSKQNIATESPNEITPTANAVTLSQITADESIVPSTGVSIYFELVIKNGKNEGLTPQTITLSADATTNGIANVKVTDCTEEIEFADKATQILQERPRVTAIPNLEFIPAQP